MENLTGKYIDRYKILDLLGQGGMATVYKAYDARLEREVAIKIVRREAFPPEVLEDTLKRFEREAKSLARLSHPNIVKVLDYGEYEGSPFLVLEYLPGGTLVQKIGAPMFWKDALQLLLPVARGVEYAHKRDIIHRDIKPANILVTEQGGPTLSDFGIAKLFQNENADALTATGMAMGTPEYMAPEQWTGNTGPKSDMYALGIILYELITGRRPYIADTPGGVFLKQATEPLLFPSEIISQLPASVEHFLVKTLSRDPARRYADLGEFTKEIEKLLNDEDVDADYYAGGSLPEKADQITVSQEAVVPVAKPLHTSRRLILFAGIGAALIVALIIAFALKPVPRAAEITDASGAQMILIPAGDFTMGSVDGDTDEAPVHTVFMDDYYIDKFEVTNALYKNCVTAGVCMKPLDAANYDNPKYAEHPVVYVDWSMAKNYCEWRGAKLPTEAQWEKAARGTDARTYPWGEGIDCSEANYENCIGDTKPFNNYANGTSPYGVYNMAGNVWEWTSNWYSATYDGNSSAKNPTGPDKGDRKVLRGGGWNQHEYLLRTTARLGTNPTDVFFSFGFRCASDVMP